jgi:type II secretion system protein H
VLRHRANQGFTLVELMVILGLVGLLISISVPSMQGYMRANRLDVTCDQLSSDLALTRSLAVAQGRILRFSATTAGYQITDPDNGDVIRQRTFGGDIALGAATQADFFPWGAADATILDLGNGCQTRTVNILPTGIVEVGS